MAEPTIPGGRRIGPRGIALIRLFEGCARIRADGLIEAYPDPGTGGDPWTIGWGATGLLALGGALYSATKAAVAVFSEALRKEVSPDGVRVVTVYPGFVDTEFFNHFPEAKRRTFEQMKSAIDILQSEDVAAVIVFALTRPAHVSLNEIVVRPTRQVP